MFDNFSEDEVKEGIKIIKGVENLSRIKIEVSGGVNLNNIRNYVIEGVDRIAIGSLTHTIKFPDISMLIE